MEHVVAFCSKFLPCRSLPTEAGGGRREGGRRKERGREGGYEHSRTCWGISTFLLFSSSSLRFTGILPSNSDLHLGPHNNVHSNVLKTKYLKLIFHHPLQLAGAYPLVSLLSA